MVLRCWNCHSFYTVADEDLGKVKLHEVPLGPCCRRTEDPILGGDLPPPDSETVLWAEPKDERD